MSWDPKTMEYAPKFRYCEYCTKTVDRDYAHICRVLPPETSFHDDMDNALAAIKRREAFENPPPTGGDEDVTALAIRYLNQKSAKGACKYGSILKTFNGRSALVDALEDSADTFLYLYQACREQGLV